MGLKAVLADVHANLEALEAVLAHAKDNKAEEYIFLGDYVGYGADPVACLEYIEQLSEKEKVRCILGNHDKNVLDYLESEVAMHFFEGNPFAQMSWEYAAKQLLGGFSREQARKHSMEKLCYELAWKELAEKYPKDIETLEYRLKKGKGFLSFLSKNGLSAEELLKIASKKNIVKEIVKIWDAINRGRRALSFLRDLKNNHIIKDKNAVYVHSNPLEPSGNKYVVSHSLAKSAGLEREDYFTQKEVCEQYEGKETWLFVGHSHFPTTRIRKIKGHYLFNVGSVGQHREKKAGKHLMKATYALFDDEKEGKDAITLQRVDYNWRKTEQKCKDANLRIPVS